MFSLDALFYLKHAVINSCAFTVATITSFQTQVEWYLRCGGLVVTMAVGVYSLAQMRKRSKETYRALTPEEAAAIASLEQNKKK